MSSFNAEQKPHNDITQLAPSPPKKNFFRLLGPGLITGASDDDPSGIATYSQVGAKFGFSVLWTMVASYPLMSAVQEISGNIGRVTGRGIAGNMRRHFPRWLTVSCIGAMVIANVINIAADISAMGSAVNLVVGGPAIVYSAVLAIVSLLLQVYLPYTQYVKWLKWLTLVLFSYVATVFVVHVPWGRALKETFLPRIHFSSQFFTALAAIFGTTISPYLLFWQSSQEVEEIRIVKKDKPLVNAPSQGAVQLNRIHIDTLIGMGFSNLIAYFIMLTAAATLHANGKTEIDTAAQAAEALRPLGGNFAFLLFSCGIVGTGLLALPVLAGSAAYAIGESRKWRIGLELKPLRAKYFYAMLSVVMLLGLALNFVHLDPIKALYWSAVVNGMVSPPIMIVMMIMASDALIMKSFVIPRWLKVSGWLATGVMFLVAILSIAGWLF